MLILVVISILLWTQMRSVYKVMFFTLFCQTDATKITLAPSNADINQGENVTLQCHASHDPTMDLTFTWALNGVLLDLEEPNGHYRRMEGVSTWHERMFKKL